MTQQRRPKFNSLWAGVLSTCLLVPAGMSISVLPALAQVVNSTISGTVQDATGAVIPNAPITLINQATGDKRSSKSNGSGAFSFTGLPSGDFTVTIAAPGFETFTEKGVHLDPGDSRDLPNLKLTTGVASDVITVEGQTDVPLDTGEKADLITSEEIKHLSVEGRDVTELFKTLPGFAISGNNTNTNNQGYDPSQVNVTGASNYYSANGNLSAGISLHLDGQNITDPGNYGGTLQNINYDQISEVKVQTSNFGADIANGPIVVSSVTRSGTDHYHGQLYTYARTSQLNSSDALNGPTGQAKDPDHEVYPGFTVGGPVLIPGTNFNHSRALTFFAGAEDYAQRNVYAYGSSGSALLHSLVPTAAMRNGDFSASAIQAYLGPNLCATPTVTNGVSNATPGSPCAQNSYQNVDPVPTFAKDGTPLINGQLPMADFDPGYKYIVGTFPLPNHVPTLSNPYNYQAVDFINDDLWQVIGRVDLAISQRNHFFGRYSTEHGASGEPAAIYYNPNGLNTPGGGLSSINSQAFASNLTTIITPTLTNQLFANLVYLDQAFVSANASVLTGYPYQGAFANGRHPLPELQGYNDNVQDGGLPLSITPDYSLGPIFAHKLDPEGGDNVTKVWGTHTATFGVYGERITNNQEANNQATNGYLANYYLPGAGSPLTDLPVNGHSNVYTMSGNWVADNFEGFFQQYGQQNILPQVNLYFWNNDFFANDSWRIKPRLTVNYGVRFEHDGLWNDQYGQGVPIFEPQLIASGASNSPYPGFLWHGIDPALPKSGNKSYPLFVEPRLGFAWDVKGTGKTVLRGGWGEYRAHDTYNNIQPAVNITQNTNTISYTGGQSLAAVAAQNVSPAVTGVPNRNSFQTTGTEYATTAGDREQPLADTYSLTLNQQLPQHMALTVSYVGDNNRFLINGGSTQPTVLDDVNAIPIGGMYRPDPDSASANYGKVLTPTGINPAGVGASNSDTAPGASTQQQNEYRPLNTPLVQYGPIDVTNHNLFANYNALQVGLARQTGRILFNVNYTYSHALGVRGAGADDANGFPGDPFNIYNDYGDESFDRRQIFNATYTFETGNAVHNRFIGGFTNGWELSGITSLQSGADIPALALPNLGVTGQIGPSNITVNGATTANPNLISVTNVVYLGTPDVTLQPTVTCNPRSGLGANQYINPSCFGLPSFLHNGQYILPRLNEPGFFDTDLSAQKAITFHHEQSVIFRISAFNFINHPLTTLTSAFSNEYSLNYTEPNATGFAQTSSNAGNGFGTLPYKTGRRITELMLKYTF